MKFKKIIFYVILFICFSSNAFPCFAEELQDDILNEAGDQLDELNMLEFEKFSDGILLDVFDEDSRGLIEKLMRGEFSGIDEVFGYFIELLNKNLTFVVPICASIIIICVLYNTVGGFLTENSSIKKVVHYALSSALILLILKNVYDLISISRETIGAMVGFMNLVFPLLITLMTVSSGGASGGIFSPIMVILSSSVSNIVVEVAFPVFTICLILSVLGNLSDSVKLETLRNFLKSIVNWVLGISFGLFSAMTSGASLINSGITSNFMKISKNTLSGYIPIIGKYLSSGIDVVSAGSLLIRNSIGVVSLIIMLLIVFIPVIRCLIFSLALKLSAGIVESFADPKTVKMLVGVSESFKTIIFSLIGVGVAFFITVICVIVSSGAGL